MVAESGVVEDGQAQRAAARSSLGVAPGERGETLDGTLPASERRGVRERGDEQQDEP